LVFSHMFFQGDVLAVYPHNNDHAMGCPAVDEMFKFYGVTSDTPLHISPLDPKNKKFPESITVGQLFHEMVDLFGKPSHQFYALLANIATDAKEKEHLEYILSEVGKEEYKRRQEDTITYADLLMEFKSAHLPLPNLLDAIPLIKPRLVLCVSVF